MTVYIIKRTATYRAYDFEKKQDYMKTTTEYYGGKFDVWGHAPVYMWLEDIGQALKWKNKAKAEKRADDFMDAEVVALEI